MNPRWVKRQVQAAIETATRTYAGHGTLVGRDAKRPKALPLIHAARLGAPAVS